MVSKTEKDAIEIAVKFEKSEGRRVINLQSGRFIRGIDLFFPCFV